MTSLPYFYLFQNDTNWSWEQAICSPVDCGNLCSNELPTIEDLYGVGYVNLRLLFILFTLITQTGSSVEAVAEHSCSTGYQLDGVQDGKWSGNAPSCKQIKCQRIYYTGISEQCHEKPLS